MGVKGLIHFLRKEFPQCFASATHLKIVRFDEVYIDANPILHKIGRAQPRDVAHHEYNALVQAFQSPERLSQSLPFTRKQITQFNAVPFFRSLYDSFHAILFRFQAARKLYISVDGPASLAKLKTQRERRRENEEESGLRSASFFNRRKFTPGNLFMGLVDRHILYVSQDYLLVRKAVPPSFALLYDGSTSSGESDLKIFSEIYATSKRAPTADAPLSRVICSSDSDMILYAIGSGLSSLFCIDPFIPPHISHSCFCSDVFTDHLKSIDAEHANQLRADFLFLCLFHGNDYFPAVQGCSPSSLWLCYLEMRKRGSGLAAAPAYFIDLERKSLNVAFLKDFAGVYLEFVAANATQFHSELSDAPVDPDDPECDAAPSGGTHRTAHVEPSHADGATIKSFLEMTLWSLNNYFTGKCANALQHYTQTTGPSMQDFARMELPSEAAWLPLRREATPSGHTPIPLVSSLLLSDDSEAAKSYLPACVHDLHKEFHRDARYAAQSDLQNLLQLSSHVEALPDSAWSPYERDCSFASGMRSALIKSEQGLWLPTGAPKTTAIAASPSLDAGSNMRKLFDSFPDLKASAKPLSERRSITVADRAARSIQLLGHHFYGLPITPPSPSHRPGPAEHALVSLSASIYPTTFDEASSWCHQDADPTFDYKQHCKSYNALQHIYSSSSSSR